MCIGTSHCYGQAGKISDEVLFISSYSYDWESVPKQLDGIHKSLSETATIRYMFMNTKNLSDAVGIPLFYEQMKLAKQHGVSFDLVILGDDTALAFAMKYRKEFFDNVPLVFEGINSINTAYQAKTDTMVTGVVETFPIDDTIRIARKLYPSARQVVAISDSTLSGKGSTEQFYDFQEYFPELKFVDIDCSKLTRNELVSKIASYGPETILLYLMFTNDSEGIRYPLSQSVGLLTAHAKIPIFKADEIGIGYGLLGGKVISFEEMSRDAGKMASQILSGISPLDIPVAKTKEYYLFDNKVMARYGIHKDLLPADATIINEIPTFYQEHKDIIPYGIALICVLIVALVVLLADNRRKRKLNKYLHRVAYRDSLTGEYNKAYFCLATRQMIDNDPNCSYSIMRIDLDNFKAFNDVCGTDMGDALLRYIAQGRRSVETDGSGTYGYLGDDHFIFCVPTDKLDPKKIQAMMQSLLDSFPSPLHITPCFGVYHINDKSVPVELMCDRALLALRSVKDNAQNHIGIYDDNIRERMIEEQSLLGDLEQAFSANEFVVYFQPQYSSEQDAFVSAEALARWNHPTKGLLMPNMFVPLFERKGYILRLDEYVWEEACRWLHGWIAAGNRPIGISVNISRNDIYDQHLCEKLVALRSKYEIPPEYFHLEITESAYLQHSLQLIQTVHELQSNGFMIEMDDFGSGYSSLNSLKDVPVDVLKMDLKFLIGKDNEVRGGSIVRSVVSMGHWLNLRITAEGVETVQQVEFLRSIGCEFMQGFYFSKPLPIDDFEKLLKDNPHFEKDPQSILLISDEELNAFWNPNDRVSLLFNSIIGAASIIEYTHDAVAVMRINGRYLQELTMSAEFFHKGHLHSERWVHPDFREKVFDGMSRLLETGDCEVVECRFQVDDDRYIWIRIRHGVIAKMGDGYLFYSVLENIDDEKRKIEEYREKNRVLQEQQYELERYRIIVGQTNTTVFDLNTKEDKYFHTDSYAHYAMSKIPYRELFLQQSKKQTVYEDDRDKLSKVFRGREKGSLYSELDLRLLMVDGSYRWTHLAETYIVDKDGEHIRTVGTLTDIDAEVNAKLELEKANERMENVISNIPVGIGIYEVFNRISRPIYVSELMCSMIGLTIEEYNALMQPSIPDMYLSAFDNLKAVIADLKPGRTPYVGQAKFHLKSGKDVWLRLMATFIVSSSEKPIFVYVTVIDITKEVLAEQSEKWKDKRYRVLIESANAMIFDFDPIGDVMTYTLMEKGLSKEVAVPDYWNYLPHSHIIHPDSLEVFSSHLKAAQDRPMSGSCDYLAVYNDQGYRWHRAYYVSLADENGLVYRVVGSVNDIHDEKVKFEKLLEKAEIDAVTELYNRSTTEELINYELRNAVGEYHAIVEVDVDHFKRINDTYGHPVGDRVLRLLSDILKKSCRRTDIAGRVGGDEFIVFFCNIKDESEIVKRVESIMQKVSYINTSLSDVLKSEVTVSIGISFSSSMSSSFDDAFACVDKALYHVKGKGGNDYYIYRCEGEQD